MNALALQAERSDSPFATRARRKSVGLLRGSDGLRRNLARISEKYGDEGGRINDHDVGSARESVFVVSEDIVCATVIQEWQLIDATKDFF